MPPTKPPEPDRFHGTPTAPWQEDAPQPGGNAQTSEAQPIGEPRFGTVHLVVWSIVTALYVGALEAMSPYDLVKWHGPAQRFLHAAYRSLGWPSGGATLAGLLLLVHRRRSGLPFPRHPGEWLWVAMGGTLLIRLSAMVGAFIVSPGASLHSVCACCYLAACILFLAVRRHAGTAGWRCFCSWVIGINLAQATWWAFWKTMRGSRFVDPAMLYLVVNSLLPIVPGVILAVVVFRGRKLRGELPWPHWAGAGLYLYGWLLNLLRELSYRLVWFL